MFQQQALFQTQGLKCQSWRPQAKPWLLSGAAAKTCNGRNCPTSPNSAGEFKYKYKSPSPSSPPWGRGSPPFTVGELLGPHAETKLRLLLIGPRGRRLSQSAVWEVGPFMKALQDSGTGSAGCGGFLWSHNRPPGLRSWPGGGDSLAGETPARGCRICRTFWKFSWTGPGSRAVCFRGCGHEVIFLLIGVMCFQFPSSR